MQSNKNIIRFLAPTGALEMLNEIATPLRVNIHTNGKKPHLFGYKLVSEQISALQIILRAYTGIIAYS